MLMARLGVKVVLILQLQSMKTFKTINSCNMRLVCKKFTVNMNLTYYLNMSHEFYKTIYYNFMGNRLHGSLVMIQYGRSVLYADNIKHSLFNRGVEWYSYNSYKIRDEIMRRTQISINDSCIVLTPEPKHIYKYEYEQYDRFTELLMSTDLVSYKHVIYTTLEPKVVGVSRTVYKQVSPVTQFPIKEPSYENLNKLLFEN